MKDLDFQQAIKNRMEDPLWEKKMADRVLAVLQANSENPAIPEEDSHNPKSRQIREDFNTPRTSLIPGNPVGSAIPVWRKWAIASILLGMGFWFFFLGEMGSDRKFALTEESMGLDRNRERLNLDELGLEEEMVSLRNGDQVGLWNETSNSSGERGGIPIQEWEERLQEVDPSLEGDIYWEEEWEDGVL